MFKSGVALAALGLLVGATLASAKPIAREPVSVRVSTHNLDLASPDDISKLRERIQRGIALACRPGEQIQTSLSPDWQCRKEMAHDAYAQIARLSEGSGTTATR